jgi:TetR/AcrR family transcriptional repressor of nem operon
MSSKRTELENAATQWVQRAGMRDLSFRTLADKVGVKSSSVHYYFPEKSDLTVALIDGYTQAFGNRLQQIENIETSLQAKLLGFVALFEEAAQDDKFCLCGMLAAEIASLDEASRTSLKLFFSRGEAWLARLFSQYSDYVVSPLAHEELATVVMSGLEGAILLDRVQGMQTHLPSQKKLILSLLTQPK